VTRNSVSPFPFLLLQHKRKVGEEKIDRPPLATSLAEVADREAPSRDHGRRSERSSGSGTLAHLVADGRGNRRRGCGVGSGGRGRVQIHGLRYRRRLHGGLDGTVGQFTLLGCLLACGSGRGGSLARLRGLGKGMVGVVWSSSAFDRSALRGLPPRLAFDSSGQPLPASLGEVCR
jgi:hypothetical protein